MAQTRRPPNLRKTTSKSRNCHKCKHMNRMSGRCVLFLEKNGKRYRVHRDEVCNVWVPRK